MKLFRTLAASTAALVVAAALAYAANTTFVTSIGDLVFPFSPPTTNPPAPGSITNMVIGFAGQGTPTIASGACGATTNGTIGAGSTNQSGLLQIGAAATTVCTVTFTPALPAAPSACNATPANAAAAVQATTVARISSVTAAGFVITGTALANANYYYTCF
jgi:hypothetical protein